MHRWEAVEGEAIGPCLRQYVGNRKVKTSCHWEIREATLFQKRQETSSCVSQQHQGMDDECHLFGVAQINGQKAQLRGMK